MCIRDSLYNISRMLTEKLADKPLDAVRQTFAELLRDAESNRRLLGDALNAIEQKLGGQDAVDGVIGGGAEMCQPGEGADIVGVSADFHRPAEFEIGNALRGEELLLRCV